MKIKNIILLMLIAILANGCCSYAVNMRSKNIVAKRKAFASGDEVAIRATRLGSNGVGLGIDVSNWEALKERPFLQIGAAILDVVLIYGGYEGVKSLEEDSKSSSRVNHQITINGDVMLIF